MQNPIHKGESMTFPDKIRKDWLNFYLLKIPTLNNDSLNELRSYFEECPGVLLETVLQEINKREI